MKTSKARSLTSLPHFAALRHRDYRSTWTANMFSGSAMWTFIVASSWLALDRSDSSAWVGVIMFSSMLPFLLVSPIAGLMADRFDRRNLALATFAASAVNGSVLAVLALLDVVQLWHVAVLAFTGGVLRAAQEPVIQALIPNQVPREDLLNAITLNGATRHGSRFFGLLVAAPLMAVDSIGVQGVLVLSAAFQGLGALFILKTRTVSKGESQPEHGVMRSMVDGLVYIYSNRAIALFVLLVLFHCALVMSFESILPIFSRRELGAIDGSILGYLIMGFGVGSLAGVLLLAGVRGESRKGRLLLWTGIASGLTPVVLALAGSVPLAVVAAAGMGASQATFMALTNTYVQSLAPDRLRGRIASLYVLHAGGIMAFSNLGYGFMADAFSAPPILFATGLLFIAVLLALSLGQEVLRRLYRTGQVATA
ncbi:MAG: MFS transporter [Chloroflexi bacterium]|nr:MFS transporter [Chloroflexota bacterium]